MKELGSTRHTDQIEMTKAADGEDALACYDLRDRLHRSWHYEREDAQKFLDHLYNHRLNGQTVSQKAIDNIHKRLKEGRRLKREG